MCSEQTNNKISGIIPEIEAWFYIKKKNTFQKWGLRNVVNFQDFWSTKLFSKTPLMPLSFTHLCAVHIDAIMLPMCIK